MEDPSERLYEPPPPCAVCLSQELTPFSYEIDDEDLAFLAELPPPDRRICTRQHPSFTILL